MPKSTHQEHEEIVTVLYTLLDAHGHHSKALDDALRQAYRLINNALSDEQEKEYSNAKERLPVQRS